MNRGAFGHPKGGIVPAATIYNTSNPSITSGTSTVVLFDSVRFDTAGMWDRTDPNRLKARVEGLYLCIANIEYSFHATGGRLVLLIANNTVVTPAIDGSIIAQDNRQAITTGSLSTQANVAQVFRFKASEWLNCVAYHEAGTNINVQADGTRSAILSMAWIGP